MKLLGAILVIFGAGMGGVLMAQTLRERVEQLQQFIRGFQMLTIEIGYGLCPLETAFRRISTSLGAGIGVFFTRVADILSDCGNAEESWRKAIVISKKDMALHEAEWVGIEAIAPLLGATDLEHQIKVFREAAERLRIQEEEAKNKAAANERVFRYAGFALGAVLVLVLY